MTANREYEALTTVEAVQKAFADGREVEYRTWSDRKWARAPNAIGVASDFIRGWEYRAPAASVGDAPSDAVAWQFRRKATIGGWSEWRQCDEGFHNAPAVEGVETRALYTAPPAAPVVSEQLRSISDRLRNLSRIMAGGDGTKRIDTPAWQHAEMLANELAALSVPATDDKGEEGEADDAAEPIIFCGSATVPTNLIEQLRECVPAEAKKRDADGLTFGGVIAAPDWLIASSAYSVRCVDERMAYGWNQCREAMLELIASLPTDDKAPAVDAAWRAYIAGYKQGANDYTPERLDQTELAATAEGSAIHDGYDLAAPASPHDVDALAQEIRRVDGSHSLGAGALAEALMPYIGGRTHDVDAVRKKVNALWQYVQKASAVLGPDAGTLGMVGEQLSAIHDDLTAALRKPGEG